jgi:hypothetical protein
MAASWKQYYGAKGSILASGGIDGWHLVSTSPTKSMANTSIQKNEDGDFITASKKSSGKRLTITETWKPDGDTSGAPTVTIGDINGTTAVESASLQCPGTDRPTLTITGHVHETTQDDNASCKHIGDTIDYQFTMPDDAYGAADPFGGDVTGASAEEITSSTETATIGHVDEYGRTGEFLVGCSRGLTVTAHYDATTDNDCAVGDVKDKDWTITSSAKPTTNEGMVKLSVDGTKYIPTT